MPVTTWILDLGNVMTGVVLRATAFVSLKSRIVKVQHFRSVRQDLRWLVHIGYSGYGGRAFCGSEP